MYSPLTAIRLLPLLLNALVINCGPPVNYGGVRSDADAEGNSAAQLALLQVRVSHSAALKMGPLKVLLLYTILKLM